MNKDTLIFIVVSYSSMALGICLPQFGPYLRNVLPLTLLLQLFLCFLAVLAPTAAAESRKVTGLPRFMAVKMLITPLICWGVFALILPQYTLGAILLGGVAVGVTAPFFGLLAEADVPFTIASVIISCLLLPFTMPLLVVAYLYVSGQNASSELWTAFMQTGLSLAVYIFLPYLATKVLWKRAPNIAAGILAKRYSLSVAGIACCMFTIFSLYSEPLSANPIMVIEAISASFLLAGLFLGIGALAARKESGAKATAYLVSLGTINNGLMLILSAQFFGLSEVLVTAMYSIPLFIMVLPYQAYRRRRRRGE